MPTPLPLSFIAEFAYCPRSAYWLLTDAPRSRDENEYIQDGRGKHSVVDSGYTRHKNSKKIESNVRIFSEQLGINGKIDVLEFDPKNRITPVEFKRGKTRYNNMHEMQLNLAAICLNEMFPGFVVVEGVVYFTDDRRRQTYEITDATRQNAVALTGEVHAACANGIDPRHFPMKKDTRCNGCCFRGLCYY